jgi:ATP-binding cassette subfamily F protein 3
LLEHFLRNYKEACLIVSHDRSFLGATCTHTLDLTRGTLTMYAGKIDAFLVNQQEQRERDERTNATVLAKRRHLEEFIAKNKARASTATRARSKSRQLEKLETIDIAGDEAKAVIRAPEVEPRKGPAVRCRELAIGYPEREVARDIDLEIDHGSRAAVVGDNGQGKTTLLRTLVDSLKPLAGEVRWGYGCTVGVYAQHVYTSLPDRQTVMEYLETHAASGTKTQAILDQAAALLFRGDHIEKPISVLSGGERARLCLAGLLLAQDNVLVLDEPGNHLDVDTVEALAEALLGYKGTVIFTSHDRHFMKRVATSIVEVRDGRAINYRGTYDAYLYSVNKEIDDEERERESTRLAKPPAAAVKSAKGSKNGSAAPAQRNERAARKELTNLERTIAQLDEQKRQTNDQLMKSSDAVEALRLHNEVTALSAKIAEAEDRWCQLQEELAEFE